MGVAAVMADAAVRVQVIQRPGTPQGALEALPVEAAEAGGAKSPEPSQTAQIQMTQPLEVVFSKPT